MKKISILGCGWLGFPLAKSLVSKGFSVKGSTTSFEKISILAEANITPFLLELTSTDVRGEIKNFLEDSDILIIDIPPKLRNDSSESYVKKIHVLISFIEKSKIRKVILVSSTSVYPDTNSIFTDESLPQPETESGRQLLKVEQLLQNNNNFKTTVLRFGGLIGPDRHPVHFLAGRKGVDNPDAPINLIHQSDCIGILEQIIAADCFAETFNAVAPFHPKREVYYTQKALELNLTVPEFNHTEKSAGKTILSQKIEMILNYTFKNNL